MALYLDLPIVSTTNPPVNWGYSRGLDGFIHLVTRGQFERVVPVHSFSMFASGLWRMMMQTGQSFGWLYLVFAMIPFFMLLRMSPAARKWIGALAVISICVGPLLAALLNSPGDRQSQELVETYFLPLRVPLAVCMGMGLIFVAAKVAHFSERIPRAQPVLSRSDARE